MNLASKRVDLLVVQMDMSLVDWMVASTDLMKAVMTAVQMDEK